MPIDTHGSRIVIKAVRTLNATSKPGDYRIKPRSGQAWLPAATFLGNECFEVRAKKHDQTPGS